MTLLLTEYDAFDSIMNIALTLLEKEGFLG